MPPAVRSAKPVAAWLAEQSGLDAHLPAIERLLALQADVDAFCDGARCGRTLLRESSRAEFVWIARTPAQASKLRNLVVGLREFLSQRGRECREVVVRVQPDKFPSPASEPVRHVPPKPGIPTRRLAQAQALAATLDPGPLREALEALVIHHGG